MSLRKDRKKSVPGLIAVNLFYDGGLYHIETSPFAPQINGVVSV